MKRFKSKKRRNYLFLYFIIFLLSIVFSLKYIYNQKEINKNTIAYYIVNDSVGKFNSNLKDVDFILKYALNLNMVKENKKEEEVLKEENTNKEIIIPNSQDKQEEIEKEEEKKKLEKIVYIYNTHQEEKYKSNYLEAFNIEPSVFMASKMLKEYLENLGIGVLVEERNVADKLHSLNLKYSGSYKVTRIFMEDAYKNNPSLKYFIDLHRDSSSYEKTTTKINDVDYAKLLFIIGLENPNYKVNLEFATKMKDKIVKYDSSLFRSIYKKSGAGVNGVYNQDFHKNVMLVEVGGQYNTINEVDNTLQLFAKILAEYIKEDQNE